VALAERLPLSADGRKALEWLRSRGLSKATIKAAGYCHRLEGHRSHVLHLKPGEPV
jgi:hypothetical protein